MAEASSSQQGCSSEEEAVGSSLKSTSIAVRRDLARSVGLSSRREGGVCALRQSRRRSNLFIFCRCAGRRCRAVSPTAIGGNAPLLRRVKKTSALFPPTGGAEAGEQIVRQASFLQPSCTQDACITNRVPPYLASRGATAAQKAAPPEGVSAGAGE